MQSERRGSNYEKISREGWLDAVEPERKQATIAVATEMRVQQITVLVYYARNDTGERGDKGSKAVQPTKSGVAR